ncbi:MAG: hypothetical protein AB1428_12290, partial [Bacteroidota bacterium]
MRAFPFAFTKTAVLILAFTLPANAQLLREKREFTRVDTLRGMLTPERTCYDVRWYHLDVR